MRSGIAQPFDGDCNTPATKTNMRRRQNLVNRLTRVRHPQGKIKLSIEISVLDLRCAGYTPPAASDEGRGGLT